MSVRKTLIYLLDTIGWILSGLCISLAANCFLRVSSTSALPIVTAVCVGLAGLLLPFLFTLPLKGLRLRLCCYGTICLKAFLFSTTFSVIYQIRLLFLLLPDRWETALWSVLLCIGVEALLFWVGILVVYCCSHRLGLKLRLIGILCGLIPIANLVALLLILRATTAEVGDEYQRQQLQKVRAAECPCATRYPVLLVHGVFFRDTHFFSYWGRIPAALTQNGARIYYGNQPSAASVADCSKLLADRIREIVLETGCEKVNIIAHSKGGLDSRWAIAMEGAAPYVASLTTVNSPHRGCAFVDYLLTKCPESVQQQIARTYNLTLGKLGEPSADFLAAVADLTAEACIKREALLADKEAALYADAPSAGILRHSIGSQMDKASGGGFPLNLTYHFPAFFDGPNDGLVAEGSFRWGDRYTYLTPTGDKGISHCDIIDQTGTVIDGFDVREFYVDLVSELKILGL
ncbi:MAG: triacylglycerol lipase [Clostridia bacterium]|nr:triacylglycerol lipase [Clostridia bacterium]